MGYRLTSILRIHVPHLLVLTLLSPSLHPLSLSLLFCNPINLTFFLQFSSPFASCSTRLPPCLASPPSHLLTHTFLFLLTLTSHFSSPQTHFSFLLTSSVLSFLSLHVFLSYPCSCSSCPLHTLPSYSFFLPFVPPPCPALLYPFLGRDAN